VEIVYSYRVQDELYTGIHEEHFLATDSLTDYVDDSEKEEVLLSASNRMNPKCRSCAKMTRVLFPSLSLNN